MIVEPNLTNRHVLWMRREFYQLLLDGVIVPDTGVRVNSYIYTRQQMKINAMERESLSETYGKSIGKSMPIFSLIGIG